MACAAIRRGRCMGFGRGPVIMCLKGSVAEHSPSKKRGARIVCYCCGARSWPLRQVKSTLQQDNYLSRETKHLLLSMYRHQGNVLQILSTSNTWHIPHNTPLQVWFLQQAALKSTLPSLPLSLALIYPAAAKDAVQTVEEPCYFFLTL